MGFMYFRMRLLFVVAVKRKPFGDGGRVSSIFFLPSSGGDFRNQQEEERKVVRKQNQVHHAVRER